MLPHESPLFLDDSSYKFSEYLLVEDARVKPGGASTSSCLGACRNHSVSALGQLPGRDLHYSHILDMALRGNLVVFVLHILASLIQHFHHTTGGLDASTEMQPR